MSLRRVNAVRYVAPLREGGSLPVIFEGDDAGLYVAKMRGAGQGTLALVSEVISGEIARRLGLPVPEIVLVELDAVFGRNERDPEIQDLLRASIGTNAALGFLEGAVTFDPAAGDRVSAELASMIVWLDAFTMNVDRTPRNPNLLCVRGEVWLIDHGASLFFHHNWPTAESKVASPFVQIKDHVLLPWASEVEVAGVRARTLLSGEVIAGIVALTPDDWFEGDAAEARARYVEFLTKRLEASASFEEEVQRARASLV